MRPLGAVAAVLTTVFVMTGLGANVVADEPYVESMHHEGNTCGVATPAVKWATCATLGMEDDWPLEFEVAAGMEELVIGVMWEPTTPAGATFNLLVENDACGFGSCAYTYADVDAESPIVVRITDDDITNPEFLWSNIEDTRVIQMRLFVGGDVGVMVDQPYDVHVHEFYHQRAPADFNPFA